MRGPRRLGDKTELFFRYRLSEGDSMCVELRNSKTMQSMTKELKQLKPGAWNDVTVSFGPLDSKAEVSMDEVLFLPAKRAAFWIDDVLLYEPGETR
jgi:hypothetical protein